MADLIAFPYDSLLSEGDSGLELDRAVDALFFRKMMRQYFTTGVFSPGFQVLASEKSIIVKKGSANINGVYAELEEDVTINITEYISSSTTVVLAVALRNDDTQSQRKTSVRIITDGTNNLVPPTRNATYYDIYIAKVTLDPNAITVYQSDITDLRLNNEYCGIVTATIQNVDTTTFYDQFQGALDRYLDTVDSALDQTLAGNLQNQIDDLLASLQTTSGKVDEAVKYVNFKYSTTEQWTGEYWIGGQKIYCKTINIGALNSANKDINHNITNLDIVLDVKGYVVNGEKQYVPLPRTHLDGANDGLGYIINSTKISIQCGQRNVFVDGYVTMYYTKVE